MSRLCKETVGTDTGATAGTHSADERLEMPSIGAGVVVSVVQMKTVSFLLALSMSLPADELRTWTHLETGKTIQAKIIGKDDAKVQIETREGKAYWLELAKLIGADREHVAGWEKPSEEKPPIAIEVLEKHETFQKIKVTATTGDAPCVLAVKNLEMEGGYACHKDVEPNSTRIWTGTVRNTYVVQLIDEEETVIASKSYLQVEKAD